MRPITPFGRGDPRIGVVYAVYRFFNTISGTGKIDCQVLRGLGKPAVLYAIGAPQWFFPILKIGTYGHLVVEIGYCWGIFLIFNNAIHVIYGIRCAVHRKSADIYVRQVVRTAQRGIVEVCACVSLSIFASHHIFVRMQGLIVARDVVGVTYDQYILRCRLEGIIAPLQGIPDICCRGRRGYKDEGLESHFSFPRSQSVGRF